MITVVFAAVLLVAFLGGLAHFLQRGLGDMSAALKQFGMFMLTKAPAGIIDLFKDDDGNGAKTWIQFGCFWFVISAIGGFLGAWHEYDAKALDSLASIGWSWENGDAMTLFNLTTLSAAVFSDIAPMLDSLGGSGIWYYLIGIMVMVGMIIANMVGEIISD